MFLSMIVNVVAQVFSFSSLAVQSAFKYMKSMAITGTAFARSCGKMALCGFITA